MIRFILALLLASLAGVSATLAMAAATESSGVATSDASGKILVLLRKPAPNFRPGGAYGGSYGDAVGRAARDRIARRIAAQYRLQLEGDWPMPLIGLDCLIFSVPASEKIDATISQLSVDRDVEWAQPLQMFAALNTGQPYNDPLFPVAPAARLWHLADLHRISTGAGVTIAIIDSKIERSHPDLIGQVAVWKDFVEGHPSESEHHGTAIAGVIAAKANNGIGSAGVAPRARLLGLRACWQSGSSQATICNTLSLAKALHFAIERRAQIINLSLTGPPDPLLSRLIDAGLARGIIIVASIDVRQPDGGFPASRNGVVAVSDGQYSGSLRSKVSAPGHGIPTTQSKGRWHLVNGSSFSAAHVSGLLALMRERAPFKGQTIERLVLMPGGSGAIDARASLKRAVGR